MKKIKFPWHFPNMYRPCFYRKVQIFFLFLYNTYIVDTQYKHLGKALLMSTHNLSISLCHWSIKLWLLSLGHKRPLYHWVQASVAQLDAHLTGYQNAGLTSPVQQHSCMAIDHKIFSTVILSLLLIQEGQLSGSCERMCTTLVNRLEDPVQ